MRYRTKRAAQSTAFRVQLFRTQDTSDDPIVLRNSTIRRSRQSGQSVYVKRFRNKSADSGPGQRPPIHRRCEREIDVIARLRDLPGLRGRLGRLNLVEGKPEDGELVTEEVPGRSLLDVLMRPRADRSSCTAIFLAGRWIRVFQDLAPNGVDSVRLGSSSPIDLVAYCDIRLDRLQVAGYRWMTNQRRRRIVDAVSHLCGTSTEQDALTWSHGDYGPNNIVWDGRVLTPLDFAMANLDRPMKDVSYFIHRLEMLPVYWPFRRWPVAAWTRAFLRGYGRPNAEQTPIYRALHVRHLLCRLGTYVARPPRDSLQRAHNSWVRRRVRARLMSEAAQVGGR